MTKRGYFSGEDEEDKVQLKTPTMTRSRNQLAAAYAPGSFFTFEGGLGSCIALPDQSEAPDNAQITDQTREQIVIRLREAWQSWFSRAYAINSNSRPIVARQCIDTMLLRNDVIYPLGATDLAFINPLKMGYAPAPLTFVCNHCGLFKGYSSVADFAKEKEEFIRGFCQNSEPKRKHQWRQLDVIFVHWSGEWAQATPGMWEWNAKKGEKHLSGEVCSNCSSRNFILRTESPRIGEWSFACASCGNKARASWLQNDPFTTEIFQDQADKRVGERRMEPISYRASSAYYAQSEQFIVFSESDQGLLSHLAEGNESSLGTFIASKYGYGGAEPTTEEMKDILLRGGHDNEWKTYDFLTKTLERAKEGGDSSYIAIAEEELRKLVKRWLYDENPLISIQSELPSVLDSLIHRRSDFSSRYDPFVLSIEHESLVRSKLNRTVGGEGRAPFVRFRRLDQDLAPKNDEAQKIQEAQTEKMMQSLGLSELGLIREFELCRFTHGYSRVSAVPIMEKRGQQVPVRLKLFEPLKNNKRPIYVVNQANEAIYVSLQPEHVYEWLKSLEVVDLPEWDSSQSVQLGGRILERAEPFGRYFSLLHPEPASTYRYVYTLLHSYAHLFMKTISEFSGLDIGSLGEYLFPADLAFVVYRSGTTMDLGNLSSLWRNENNRFLANLLEPSSHRCNSGSLCDFGGGACPDCIMVPETSCIAQNRLLSRAVLCGGGAPREDDTHKGQRIRGFLEVVNGSSLN